jgi:hypothetical protein
VVTDTGKDWAKGFFRPVAVTKTLLQERRDALQGVVFQVRIGYLRCKATWGVNRLEAILHEFYVRRSVDFQCCRGLEL